MVVNNCNGFGGNGVGVSLVMRLLCGYILEFIMVFKRVWIGWDNVIRV